MTHKPTKRQLLNQALGILWLVPRFFRMEFLSRYFDS